MRGWIGVIAVVAGLAPARAHAEPGRYENSRWTRAGLEGSVVSDGTGVAALGAQLAVGRRVGRTHLVGEYTLSHGWRAEPGDTSGEGLGAGHRLGLGLALPVTYARVSDRSMEIAFWLEAGGGAHRLAGADTWRSNAFVGWAAEFRGYRSSHARDEGGMGFWIGGRVLVSEPESGPRAIAAGAPAPPSGPRFGVGYVGTFAWRWGR